MAENHSLELCLFDFVPNLAFLVGAFFLVRMAELARGRRCAWLMAGGTLLIFLGGMFKAIWKLLYTIGAGDVRLLSEAQFVLFAPGFLLMLLSLVVLVRGDRLAAGVGGQPTVLAMALWKVPFLIVTTVCSIGAYGLLAYIAFRRRMPPHEDVGQPAARLAGVLFIVAILSLFAMSGMARAEQTIALQWIEQGINSVGQIAFAMGSFLLYRLRSASYVSSPDASSGRMKHPAG